MTRWKALFVLFFVLGAIAIPAAARELHLASGVVQSIGVCEEAGPLLRFRRGDTWLVIDLDQVRRIEPPCGVETAPGPLLSVPSPVPTGAAVGALVPGPGTQDSVSPGQSDTVAGSTTKDPASTPSVTPTPSAAETQSGKTVNVRGYTRKDGTYVAPHTRSAPGSGTGRRR